MSRNILGRLTLSESQVCYVLLFRQVHVSQVSDSSPRPVTTTNCRSTGVGHTGPVLYDPLSLTLLCVCVGETGLKFQLLLVDDPVHTQESLPQSLTSDSSPFTFVRLDTLDRTYTVRDLWSSGYDSGTGEYRGSTGDGGEMTGGKSPPDFWNPYTTVPQ